MPVEFLDRPPPCDLSLTWSWVHDEYLTLCPRSVLYVYFAEVIVSWFWPAVVTAARGQCDSNFECFFFSIQLVTQGDEMLKMHNVVQTTSSHAVCFHFLLSAPGALTAPVTDAAALTTNSVAESCIKPLHPPPTQYVHNRRVNAQCKVTQSILIHILQPRQREMLSDCQPNTDWLISFSKYPRLNLFSFYIFEIKYW